ncbi:MAG TPA: SdrD B-like domain-containing protein, partial [Longimicrobiales bacterium]
MRRLAAASLFALTIVAGACASGDAGKILTVNTTGADIGIAFIDRNRNALFDPTDTPLPGVRVTLYTTAGAKVNTTITGATGVYVLTGIPSGSYRVTVDTTSLGDSLRVTHVENQDFTVGRDTAKTLIALGFPTSTAAVARTLPLGRKVEVDGIALNSWAAYGDSSISIVDASGAIRATRVAPVGVQAGDSISLVGTVSLLNGQPVLAAGTAFTLASAKPLPAPVPLSTAAAAAAGGGKYDATLAHITGAVILSAQLTPASELDLSVDDGS